MKTIDLLKQLQADSIVFFMKVHNYHWHVKGMNFMQIHNATEAIYEEFADIFDDVAERIIQLGGTPNVTLADCLKNAKIKEETQINFPASEVLDGILKDYEYFEKSFKALAQIAEEEGDRVSAGFADEKTAILQKGIWMIKSQRA